MESAPQDKASQVGAAQPSIDDSLRNYFKWTDFTVKKEEREEELSIYESRKTEKKAAPKIVAIDKEAQIAR